MKPSRASFIENETWKTRGAPIASEHPGLTDSAGEGRQQLDMSPQGVEADHG